MPITGATVLLVASTTVTATAQGAAISPGYTQPFPGLQAFVNETAASGTAPTIIFAIQGQDQASLSWGTVHAAITATITAAGLFVITWSPVVVASLAAYPAFVNTEVPLPFRFVWTVGGTTPSFTFSITGQYLN
jgi:hypothetical protein